MGLIMICNVMAVKRLEMLRVTVGKMKALPVKVILIGKGRWNLTCFVY
jgi:hypothetical protein